MLAADKQLLDAHLRNELQQLRRLEITNVVNRFQNALTPATLIAGFSFTGIVELEFADGHEGRSYLAKLAEPVFYMSASAALSLALYVTAVSLMPSTVIDPLLETRYCCDARLYPILLSFHMRWFFIAP